MKAKAVLLLPLFLLFTLAAFCQTKKPPTISTASATKPASATQTQPRVTLAPASVPAPIKKQVLHAYGELPLSFETNEGQTDPRVRFISRGSDYTLFLAANETVLSLRKPARPKPGPRIDKESAIVEPAEIASGPPTVLRMKLVGANPKPDVIGLEELPGKSNYFIGNDPRKWHADIAQYRKVRYERVYRGIDLIYNGSQGRLEYDFEVAPGADPNAIQFALEGARNLRIDADGDLVCHIDEGEVRLHNPRVYQRADGREETLPGGYVLKDGRQVSFHVTGYDTNRPLIIDPVLSYSTYLGGSSFAGEIGFAVAVDSSGNAIVTGATGSSDFPTANPLQAAIGGDRDAFITKFTADGSTLLYSTFLGGVSTDAGLGIAIDGTGNVYVAGSTSSSNFPTTQAAFDRSCGTDGTCNGTKSDGFVAKLNATGSSLVYSTYLGGSDEDEVFAIAVDGSGAYVTGRTISSDFPTTPGAFRTTGTNSGAYLAFVTKLNADGNALAYSTFLGEGQPFFQGSIAVDKNGSAYVAGVTFSPNFPTTPGAFDATCGTDGNCNFNGSQIFADVFVTKLNDSGSALVYSTYLGGSRGEGFGLFGLEGGIAVDAVGSAYVSSSTSSPDYPTTPGAYDTTCGTDSTCDASLPVPYPNNDAFVTKLNAAGSGLIYSTFLGGSEGEFDLHIAVDSSGTAHVTGTTASFDFPTVNPLQAGCGGGPVGSCQDVFVAELNAAGSSLLFSTYLGGSDNESALGMALDAFGSMYVTGLTSSQNFPIANAFQPSCALNPRRFCNSAFVTKIILGVVAQPPTIASIFPTSGTQGQTITNFTVNGTNFDLSTVLSFTGTGITVNSYSSRTAAQIVASITIDVSAATGFRDVTVTNPDGQQATLSGGFTVALFVGQPAISVSPTQIVFPSTLLGTTSAPATITISNPGTATLSISGISTHDPFFLVGPLPPSVTSIPAGGQATFDFVFTPNGPGPFSGSIEIGTNVSTSPTVIPLQGRLLPHLSLLFTNDVHGLWNKQVEEGTTVLQKIANIAATERQRNPDGVLLVDAGDLVYSTGDSVTAKDGNGGQTNYSKYLLDVRSAGYDAVAVGNHDFLGNKDFGFDWDQPGKIKAAVAAAQIVGLHVLSENIHALAQQPLTINRDWIQYEQQVEPLFKFLRNGLKVGVFGLTAPKNYGKDPPIYGEPFATLLTEDLMAVSVSSAVATGRQNVDILLALTHIDFNGSDFKTNPVTGCLQLIEPIGQEPKAMGEPIDVAICGHDHIIERSEPGQPPSSLLTAQDLDRGDGRPSHAFEAGSFITCTPDSPFAAADFPFKDVCDLTSPNPLRIPRPRLGIAKLAFQNAAVIVLSKDFIDLKPKYHATFHGRCPEIPKGRSLPIQQGQTVTLKAQFRNLGTRTWFKSTANPDQTQVRLGIVDSRTAAPNSSLPFIYDSGDPLRPAIVQEDSVVPGKVGTFVFRLTVSRSTMPRRYRLRVAPVAENVDGSQDWMNRGDTVDWDIQVVPPQAHRSSSGCPDS